MLAKILITWTNQDHDKNTNTNVQTDTLICVHYLVSEWFFVVEARSLGHVEDGGKKEDGGDARAQSHHDVKRRLTVRLNALKDRQGLVNRKAEGNGLLYVTIFHVQ